MTLREIGRRTLAVAGLVSLCASAGLFSGVPARGEIVAIAAAPATPEAVAGDLTHLVYTATAELGTTLIAPAADRSVTTELAKVTVATVAGAGVEIRVGGTPVPVAQLGSRSIDAKTGTTTYTFYGVRFAPGPNELDCTALGADGQRGETTRTIVYGAGNPVALSAAFGGELRSDGATPVLLTVHATDAWHNPARSGSMVRLTARSGGVTLLPGAAVPVATAPGATEAVASPALDVTVDANGDARALVVPGTLSGDAVVAFSAGAANGEARIFVRPFLRKAFVVGVISVGAGAAPGSRDGDDHLDGGGSKLGRAALFVTGESFRGVATTIAYDTASRLAPTAALGAFVDNTDEDPYRTYGDASAQRADILSRDRLFARLESGRNAFTYGRFNADTGTAAGGSTPAFGAVLSGARLDLADAAGRVHLTAFTARNDVAFGQAVIPATGLSTFGRNLQPNIIVGSEVVALAALDPRTGGVVSETVLQRNVDYVLDTASGMLRFLVVPLPYDAAFRAQVVVVRYQYAAAGAASRMTGGQIGTTFGRGQAQVNVGYVNDATGSGNFSLLQENLRLTTALGLFTIAHVGSSGAVPGATLDSTGQTWHADYLGQRGRTKLAASYDRASAGFADPFGGLTASGLTDARIALTQGLNRKGEVTLSYDAQRDALSGNAQSDLSLAARQPVSSRLTLDGGIDLRRATFGALAPAADTSGAPLAAGGTTMQAHAGADYLIGTRTTVHVQRIAALGGAASASQPGETLLSIDAKLDDVTHVFLRQLWASAAQQSFASSTSALVSSGATRRTTVGIERKVGAATSVSTEYTVERTPAGNTVTSALGVREALSLSRALKGSAYLQTAGGGGSAAVAGSGFTAYGLDLVYGAKNFHAATSLQARAGALAGTTFALSAAGALSPDLSLVGDLHSAQTGATHDLQARAGLAWRPHDNDRGAALLEIERRNGALGAAGEHVDTLSAEAAWRPTTRLELDGRAALKLDGDGFYAAHTYLVGARALQRIGSRFDIGAEARVLGTTGQRTTEFAVESGLRVGNSMRLAAGYNVTGAADPDLFGRPSRKGLYVTLTSVISHVFGFGK